MQQAVPQHAPSSVPQQQVVRDGVAAETLFGTRGRAETGVQIGAKLVLTASNATATARNGWSARFILRVYGKRPRRFSKSYDRAELAATPVLPFEPLPAMVSEAES
jgi:hypothetical protein